MSLTAVNRVVRAVRAALAERRALTEEQALSRDLKALDDADPDWDAGIATAEAARLLASGRKRTTVVGCFGEAIVQEAERRLASDTKEV